MSRSIEPAYQITPPKLQHFLERRIKIFFITHLFEFAPAFYNKNTEKAIFLRAERQSDGRRTFKLTEGEPLQTSYGEDSYNRIFNLMPLGGFADRHEEWNRGQLSQDAKDNHGRNRSIV